MGAGTPATALLVANGVPFTLHEYELEPLSGVDQHRGERIAYGDAAAAARSAFHPIVSIRRWCLQLKGRTSHVPSSLSPWCRVAASFPRRQSPQRCTPSAPHLLTLKAFAA